MDKHIVFFFNFSHYNSTTAATNVWKLLQTHLQEVHPTYRARRVDSSWWPRWHFHRLQGCSRQTCSLSPPCKSLHEWKASLVSCGDPEYLEGTHTHTQWFNVRDHSEKLEKYPSPKLYFNENYVERWSVVSVPVILNSIRQQEFYSNFSERVSLPLWNQLRLRLKLPFKIQKIPLKNTSEAKKIIFFSVSDVSPLPKSAQWCLPQLCTSACRANGAAPVLMPSAIAVSVLPLPMQHLWYGLSVCERG